MHKRSVFFVISALFLMALMGCSDPVSGDGFIRAVQTTFSEDAFTIKEKANLKVDKVQSNNAYRIEVDFAKVGSHMSLLAHTDENLAGGARIQFMLIEAKKLRVLYGLDGSPMKMVEKALKAETLTFNFEVSLYNEAGEIGVEVEETEQNLELLHAHIEEGNGTGRSIGLEFSNDGTFVRSLDIRFNIPEHAHGEAEDSGAAAPASAKTKHPKRLQLDVDGDGFITERVDLKLDGPRGDTRYHLLTTLPNTDDQVTIITNAKETKEGGLAINFLRTGKTDLMVTYSIDGTPNSVQRKISEDGKLNLAISVYSEADEVGLDVMENFTKKRLLHTHLHDVVQGREIFLTRSKHAKVQDLAIETDIPGHAH
ncbi:MAG: hypothetical protein R3B54_03040 [Bdellovibrionota bacterium]